MGLIMEIGRYLLTSFGSHPLRNGVTMTLFQAEGREQVSNGRLYGSQRGDIKIRAASLMNLVSTPSGPNPPDDGGPQSSFSWLIACCTSTRYILWKEKQEFLQGELEEEKGASDGSNTRELPTEGKCRLKMLEIVSGSWMISLLWQILVVIFLFDLLRRLLTSALFRVVHIFRKLIFIVV